MKSLSWPAISLVAFLLLGGCSSDEPKVGGSCDPAASESCGAQLVCDATDNRCRQPIGGSCDLTPAADAERECTTGTACFEPAPSAGDGTEGEPQGICALIEGELCDAAVTGVQCGTGLDCVATDDGEDRCFPPVVLAGMVSDIDTETGIGGAHVIAVDEQRAPVTDVAVSDESGNYELAVPVLRDATTGAPKSESFSLRVSAADYQTFPGGLRPALPIDVATATKVDGRWVVQSALSDVALIPLPAEQRGLAKITGVVSAGDASGGVLVVAEGGGKGISDLTDVSGNFTIFNVPDGSYAVRGFKADLQLTPVDTTVAGADVTGIELLKATDDLATLSGSVNIVNAPGGSLTSVVLAVKSTFDSGLGRGDIPLGLRAPRMGDPNIDGAFTFTGVPDGEYVILAAFENDGLIRDPDTSIAGTAVLEVTIPDTTQGRDITLSDSFKVTEALGVIGPGADGPEQVGATPTFEWADDAGEDYYYLQVFDSFGSEVWSKVVDRVTGSSTVSETYAGPALQSGMYYQFRVTSRSFPGGVSTPDPENDPAISATEDLRGVFFLP